MYSQIFGNVVCVKPWTGSASIKKATKEKIALVPETDYMVAARFGRLRDPESGELYLDIKDPMEIVKLITERGWDNLSFEELAKKLKTLHDNVPEEIKKCFEETEIHLLQPNGEEVSIPPPKRKRDESLALDKIFQKSACVKPWEGPKHAQRSAITQLAGVPGTDLMIAAKFGHITDSKTGKKINAKSPEYLAKLIINQGWEKLPFEELTNRLTELHERLVKSGEFELAQAEIHLLQSHGAEIETRFPTQKLG